MFLKRYQVARSDLTYNTKDGQKIPVFAIRLENVPEEVQLSFTKKEFVNAIVFGKFGVSNKLKTIGHTHQKATLVYMTKLPADTQDLLKKGMNFLLSEDYCDDPFCNNMYIQFLSISRK